MSDTKAVADTPAFTISGGKDRLARSEELIAKDQHDQAWEILSSLVDRHPDFHDARLLLARAYADKSEWSKAAQHYQRLLDELPTSEIKGEFALIRLNLGQEETGRALLAEVLNSDDIQLDTLLKLGALATFSRRHREAATLQERATKLDPQSFEAWLQLGYSRYWMRDLEGALFDLERAQQINPDDERLLSTVGEILHGLRRYDQAIEVKEHLVSRFPEAALYKSNLAVSYIAVGRYEDCIAICDSLLEIAPDLVYAIGNRATARMNIRQYRGAIEDYQKLFSLNGDYEAKYSEAMCWLALQNFEKGFELHESRWLCKSLESARFDAATVSVSYAEERRLTSREDAIGKTIFLVAEQGLGDTLQFIRYAKNVAVDAHKVIVSAPPELVDLCKTVLGIDEILVRGDEPAQCDRFALMMSLPRIYKTTVLTVPNEVPYLKADPSLISAWQERIGPVKALRVGLVWSGNPRHANDFQRSILFETMLPLLRQSRVQFYCLSPQVRDYDRLLLKKSRVHFFGDQISSFSDTAALCEIMDVIITVDTAVAHLAGALARPVWIMLPWAAEWRWLDDERTTSPWYPTARLFRQKQRGDWGGVIRDVIDALKVLSKLSKRSRSSAVGNVWQKLTGFFQKR